MPGETWAKPPHVQVSRSDRRNYARTYVFPLQAIVTCLNHCSMITNICGMYMCVNTKQQLCILTLYDAMCACASRHI